LNNSNGESLPLWQVVYRPFGEVYEDFDSAGFVIGNPSQDGIVWSVPFRFPGQYQDPEDELYNNIYYNWHRWYIPGIGRYNRADPVNIDGTLTKIYLLTFHGSPSVIDHFYLYSSNNPILFIDPEGLDRYNICKEGWGSDPGTTSHYLCRKYVDFGCKVSPEKCCKDEFDECIGLYAIDECDINERVAKICITRFYSCRLRYNKPASKPPSFPPSYDRYPTPPRRGPKTP